MTSLALRSPAIPIVIALIAIAVACATEPTPNQATSAAWGNSDAMAALYKSECAACHGNRLEGGALGPSLIKPPLVHGTSLEEIQRSITTGFPEKKMPAWKDVLSPSQIERLAMLILELQAGFTYDGVDPLGVPLQVPAEAIPNELYSLKLESLAGDLHFPFSIAPLPDGRVLVTEKSRGLTIVAPDGSRSGPILDTPPVYDENTYRGAALIGSGWMLEVALHPRYAEEGWVYLSYGDRCSDCNELSRSTGEPVTMLKIVRGRIRDGRWTDQEEIWHANVGTYLTGHNQAAGGRLTFDREGYLYFSVGGLSQESGIQDLDKPYGKIYRLHDDGRIPTDNPFVDVPGALPAIWSFGHRNPQGLDFDQATGLLWETEHGPRGGDELNLIASGKNYGWPMVSFGMWYDGQPIRFAEELKLEYDPAELTVPVTHWTPSPGISSLTSYRGKLFPEWTGNLLVSSLRKMNVVRLEMDGSEIVSSETLLEGLGRMRDIEVGPGGEIFLLVEQFHGSHLLKLTPEN